MNISRLKVSIFSLMFMASYGVINSAQTININNLINMVSYIKSVPSATPAVTTAVTTPTATTPVTQSSQVAVKLPGSISTVIPGPIYNATPVSTATLLGSNSTDVINIGLTPDGNQWTPV